MKRRPPSRMANDTRRACTRIENCGNFLFDIPDYCHDRLRSRFGECTVVKSYLNAVIPAPRQVMPQVAQGEQLGNA